MAIDEFGNQIPDIEPVIPPRSFRVSPSIPNSPLPLSQGLEQAEEEMVEEEPVDERPPTVEANGDDLSDLFENINENDADIYSEDLLELDDEDVMGGSDDMSDLFEVPRSAVMGEAPVNQRRKSRLARINYNKQRRQQYPSEMGGMQ